MPPIDYSERDKAVAHNIYATVRMRDGLPRDLSYAYWRDVHATLCARLPGLNWYVQQHFDRDHTSNLWPVADGVRRIDAVLDGAAELGFANLDDQSIFAKAGEILYGDEFNLFSEAIAYFLPNGSTTFVDRAENGIPNGPDGYHRVHVLMNRRPGDDASQWIADTSADLATHPLVQKWKLNLNLPYDNANPAPPSPDVNHLIADDRLNVAVSEVAFESARTAREFFAGSAFQKAFAGQATHLDAVGARKVTGVYTFVRDGKPTTAGLRGSRPAELIERIGAANQLTPDVVERFVRG